VYKESISVNIRLKFKWNWWYLAAVLIPVILGYLSFLIALLLPGVQLDPEMSSIMDKFSGMMQPEQMEKARQQMKQMSNDFKTEYFYLITGLINAIIFGATINAVFGFGEEAGWRGFLLNSLKDKGFYKASIITGIVWGIWHLPVVIQGHNYGQYRIAGIFMMTLWTVLLSPLFTYVVYKTDSVIAAAVFHGVLNAVPDIAIAYIKGGNELTTGITGLSGMISLLILNVIIFVYDRFFAKKKIII
ncbi:MAG TPA: CPBP family intramembrane metalloprotease, partial [Candidatus Goldiibacteriota bacterium]|nr:CPBP family intramembrane metalloprotease [Candidatus Goldiibacteriota bacterium]